MPSPTKNLSRKRKTKLTWNSHSEIIGLELELVATSSQILFPQYTIGLHAWFLEQVRQTDPILSKFLHDEEAEKAFSISPLIGEMDSEGKSWKLKPNETYLWTITALSSSLVKWLADWVRRLPRSLDLYDISLPIRDCRIVFAPTTYQQLWESSGDRKGSIELSFLTPTSFRRNEHHFPLPVPTNLFHSYLRRWNNFSGMPFDQEAFLAWVDKSVIIVRHTVESRKVLAGKKGSVTGFTGAIELSLSSSASQKPDFVRLFYALVKFAPYCGTGHKTTFGLGQTRLGWLAKEIQPVSSMQSLIARRIEELTESFLAKRKRTGGSRASNMAQTLATILARREVGESLQDIAVDLAMPYETVKTYAKQARKELKE